MRKVGALGGLCILALLLFCVDSVFAQFGQMNSDETLIATNYGYGIHVGWIDLPEGTTKIVLSRTPNQNGPWVAVLISEFPNDLTPLGNMLYTERDLIPPDTAKDYFYKLEAFSATGLLLKSYAPVFVPKFAWPA